MTREIYDNRLKEINKAYEEAKQKLYVEYAREERKFQIGDIIQQGDTIIKITSFKAGKFSELPYPIYVGVKLTKKLLPFKSNEEDSVLGNNNVHLLTTTP